MRRIWLAATGLALMIGSLALLFLVQPPPASAQTLPPEVTYNVTCTTNSTTNAKFVSYAASVKNPNAAGTPAVTYTLVRSWSDGRADNTASRVVAPGATQTANLLNADGVTAQWTHTLTVKVDAAVVAGPITKQNPCVDPPTTTTTTTTTTTPPASSTTTTPPSSSTTTTTPPAVTTTDPLSNPTTTTTEVVPVANEGGSGGGLAYTGVAAVAVAGIGLILFANGIGLMRLVRRGGVEE